MTRKVIVDVKVRVVINMEEGIEVADVIDEMNYNMVSGTEGVDVEDTTIEDYEVIDSK